MRALPTTCAASALVALAACAASPRATPSQPPLAASVTVMGASGPVGAARTQAALKTVAAEGRGDLLAHHVQALGSSGDVDLLRGNATRLLEDGPATFAAMRQAIAGARHSVLLQSYIVEDEGIAAEMGELLAARARAGIKVALVFDAVGSFGSKLDPLATAGVALCRFNPLNPAERAGKPAPWNPNQRDHRKLLVVDEQTAFTGGINISQVYGSGSSGGGFSGSGGKAAKPDGKGRGWRDTQIELRGPAAAALARTFGQTWHSQGCEGALDLGRRGPAPEAGPRLVKLLASDAREPDNRIYQSLMSAVQAARESVQLTVAYFAPGRELVDALADAARRGVAVELVLPGRSDSGLVLQAGRAHYTRLLAAGVRIYEVEHTVLHAKTAVIDGVWASVGSANLDFRSFTANNELNVIVLGDDFGQQMQAMFTRDRAKAREVTRVQWRERGVAQRVKEGWASLFERWL